MRVYVDKMAAIFIQKLSNIFELQLRMRENVLFLMESYTMDFSFRGFYVPNIYIRLLIESENDKTIKEKLASY